MNAARSVRCAVSALVLVLTAIPSFAQVRGHVFVSGLTHPLAFVQDPSTANVQFVVEQEGRIRVVQNGALLPTVFLDLRGLIATGGERGLIGLVFSPDYAQNGRFFVAFVNTDNHLVISRYTRSANPLVADAASRFDLQWSTGQRFIEHPTTLHYGGHMVFGADGLLYIGTGDGGEPRDANHRAQTTTSLLGKFLRIDVNVPDADAEGFDIPAGNPFAPGGGAPEVWSVGFRNPWRFSIDDPARGGTGGFLIGDVGEDRLEEISYEPPGRPQRNYGWRNREGTADFDTSLPPAFEPLIDPIHQYDRGWGRSIIGGFVYRGSAIPSLHGRYVFGDFATGRIGSLALSINPFTGEATASDLRDHTTEINAGASTRTISSFGVDASGELYVVNWADGLVISLRAGQATLPVLHIDTPSTGTRVRQPFMIAGWALDLAAVADSGISAIHVWAYPSAGPPVFLGTGVQAFRPDVGAAFGPQFSNAGYGLIVRGLRPGTYQIVVYGLVAATQTFSAVGVVVVEVEANGFVQVDLPSDGATVRAPFIMGGWAIDFSAPTGTGVATIQAWAFPVAGGPPVYLGVPSFGNRPDVAAAFGPQYLNAGWGLFVPSLPPGTWHIGVYGLSTVSGVFDMQRTFFVNVVQ